MRIARGLFFDAEAENKRIDRFISEHTTGARVQISCSVLALPEGQPVG